MKRKLLLAALVMLATLLLLGGVAMAQTTDPIVCKMEVSPSSLSAPGEVSVTITVSNSGDTDMKDPLTLYSPTSEVVTDFGDKGSVILKAGEVKTWTGKWDVNQRTLDNGQIVFFVKYTLYGDNGEKNVKSQPIRGKLETAEAKTDIEVKRTITPGTAREGQKVTVQYDIVNTGTVSLKNITLQENKSISSKTVTVAKELKAGETAQVKFPVTMGKKNLTSSATITYTSGDSTEKKTQKVDEQVILYGEAAMTAKLTSSAKGVTTNGTVKLTLELKNSGTVNYADIRVNDKTLGDVFTNQQIAAGATLKLEKEITLTKTTEYQFTITAIDNTGTTVSLNTDPLTVIAVDPNKIVHLTLVAAADRTEVYSQPGTVRFTLTIQNDSEVDATDVAIYEAKTKINTFDTIPAGQTRSMTRDAALSMAGKYQFSAVTVDALNTTSTFLSNEIQIAFSIPTPTPVVTAAAEPTPEPTYAKLTYPPISNPGVGSTPKLIRAFFYPLLWVSAILLIGAVIVLLIATRKRMTEKKASEAALDHLERVKRRDYVAPVEEAQEAPTLEIDKTKEEAPSEGIENTEPESISEQELPHMKYVRNAYQHAAEETTEAGTKPKADSLADNEDSPYRKPKAEANANQPDGNEEAPVLEDEQEAYREEEGYMDEPADSLMAFEEPQEPAEKPVAASPAKPKQTEKRRHRRADSDSTDE